ncbi:ATP-binding protein, partial [Acinetobacter baumannii]
IKVGIYDDILNIVSPGGLPNGLTEEDLAQGRSEIRNRVLARVFKELGYIEQWGSGIARIKDLCLQAGNAEPQLKAQGDFVDWEFYRPSIEQLGGSIGGSIGSSFQETMLTDRQKEILVLIQQNPKVSYRAMAEQLAINESAVKKHLNNLKDAGWLERIGGTRGYWAIMKKVGGVV